MIDVEVRRQRGGTLLGILIGMIAGLAVAWGVYALVRHTNPPFMDRVGRSSHSGAALPLGDPNSPMYGDREAARRANEEIRNRAGRSHGGAIAAAQDGVDAQAAGEEAGRDLQAAVEEITGNGAVYYVQAGVYTVKQEADSVRARIALNGLEASISERSPGGETVYRVRLGPFADLNAAREARAVVSGAQIPSDIIRAGP